MISLLVMVLIILIDSVLPTLTLPTIQSQYAASVRISNIVLPKFHSFLTTKSLRLINLNDLGTIRKERNKKGTLIFLFQIYFQKLLYTKVG